MELPWGPLGPPPLPGSECEVTDCDRIAETKGLCGAHYGRLLRVGAVRPDVPIAKSEVFDERLYVQCPDDLLALAGRCAENDARRVFVELWRLIGLWHLRDVS